MMTNTAIAVLLLALLGCADSGSGLSPERACDEQAAMFCAFANNAPGDEQECRSRYLYSCLPDTREVSIEEQLQCLDVLPTNAERHRNCVPDACVATWGRPDMLGFFCRTPVETSAPCEATRP